MRCHRGAKAQYLSVRSKPTLARGYIGVLVKMAFKLGNSPKWIS
jgi:hypothetical protein